MITFNPYQYQLPVTEIISDLQRKLNTNNTLILTAPPGAGKSTILPLALLNAPWLNNKKIILLEPRRLAASTIAHRMADLLGEQPGQTVGYRIRFENKISRNTKIEVVTEGILTRMLHTDNALEDYALIIFDEFHERSIHADIALALSREVQQILRPDLRLLIMSATLDVPQLAEMLNAPVVESKGKMYPVDIIYTGEQPIEQLPDHCSKTIARATKEQEGDTLVFLPGQAEIRKTAEILKRSLSSFAIHPLYGQLSHAEQQAALMPDPHGRRKIVLATSIAETSLTIQGIRIVVDSGYTRKSAFDPRTGLSALKTVQVSTDSADQRAGRAGRLSTGSCYRMWSAATQQRLAPYRTPEILDSDLTPLMLDLLEWGITNPNALSWLNNPPAAALNSAKELLTALGAIEGDKITDHGKQIHRLPLHPRLANMLITAQELNKLPLATDIAALLEERDPLDRTLAGADLNHRIEQLRRYRAEQRRDRQYEKIEKTAAAYRRLFHIQADNSATDAYHAGLLLAYAYPERIASAKDAKNGLFQLANGQTATINRDDDLAHEPWLSIAQLDAQKGQGKIFIAAPLNPKDLTHLAKETENIRWDSRKQQLLATADLRIGSIVLQSRPLAAPPKQKLDDVLSATIKAEGQHLLDFNPDVQTWQNRVLSLRRWNPEQSWPNVSTEALLASNQTWLGPYYDQLRKADDFKKINLSHVLQHSLTYDQQQQLNQLAPAAITVPSGSSIPLSYSPYGEAPILAVRLQELFGMLDTPTVNSGAQTVVIHLLSPGYKPVQVTTDLRSFWQNTYFEVRKELKRRYPKHSWPENPLEAEAVRGVKRKG
ncbi:ATP-dependent helicase HrpB [Paradesertivirga mongoliensis]|uniref:ATP-dependent helicase HrpB n=1 Tax=Paradesertivirga mongoliensis TaxID=2100740 RepID=A0ABW4ZQ21_9SPHI|nr:ATP-dependent helicase HrpB [Pedobacter mongoliensis]